MEQLVLYKGITFKVVDNPYYNRIIKYIVYIYNENDKTWEKFFYGRTIKYCVEATKEMIDNLK